VGFKNAPYIARPFSYNATNRMYAVVEISGQQYAVSPKQTLIVPLMDKNIGDTVEFTNILLASDNGKVSVGAPFIKGSVKATVVSHGKGDKVLVFHKKRRKGYQKLNGHRQQFTSITINDIKI
jgi:large subunit ribosomal protein L21